MTYRCTGGGDGGVGASVMTTQAINMGSMACPQYVCCNSIVLYSIVLYSIVLYSIVLYSIMLYSLVALSLERMSWGWANTTSPL